MPKADGTNTGGGSLFFKSFKIFPLHFFQRTLNPPECTAVLHSKVWLFRRELLSDLCSASGGRKTTGKTERVEWAEARRNPTEPDRNVSTAKLFLSVPDPHEDTLQPNRPGGFEMFFSSLSETKSIKVNTVEIWWEVLLKHTEWGNEDPVTLSWTLYLSVEHTCSVFRHRSDAGMLWRWWCCWSLLLLTS